MQTLIAWLVCCNSKLCAFHETIRTCESLSKLTHVFDGLWQDIMRIDVVGGDLLRTGKPRDAFNGQTLATIDRSAVTAPHSCSSELLVPSMALAGGAVFPDLR